MEEEEELTNSSDGLFEIIDSDVLQQVLASIILQ